jgi:hypothetical protein
MKVEFSEIFSNTRFFVELNKVLFGAELALAYAGTPDAKKQDIKNRIVRSAFPDMDLDYAGMFTSASGGEASDVVRIVASPNPSEAQGASPFSGGENPAETYTSQFGEPDVDSFGGESAYPIRSPFIEQEEKTDAYNSNGTSEGYITE